MKSIPVLPPLLNTDVKTYQMMRSQSESSCEPMSPCSPSIKHLGAKTITMLGSIALTMNNISGPGMLDFPATFQNAGYVPCIVTLLVVTMISSSCATLLADAMARMPSNDKFQTRVEFSDIFDFYLGRGWFKITQVAFYFCLLTQNVAAIVSTSQVLDSMIATFILNKTYAFELNSLSVISWTEDACSQREVDRGTCTPFEGNTNLIFTLGYLICTLLLFYPGLLNLEENITIQIGSYISLIVLTVYFLFMFYSQGLDYSRVPAFGEDWRDCIGVIIFNFAFCVTVPSWINEKKPDVNINTVVWSSTAGASVLYLLVGVIGGMAFPTCPDNMLVLLGSPVFENHTRFAAGAFGFLIIGLGVPIFCILMRYNLVVGGIVDDNWGVFLGGVLPWLIGWMVYSGHSLLDMLSWTGLILNGFIDFFAPALVALVAVKVMCSDKVQLNVGSFGTFTAVSMNESDEMADDGLHEVKSLSGVTDLISSMWHLRTPVPPTIVKALTPALVPYHAKVVIILIVAATVTVFVGLYMKISATINDIAE